MVDKRRSYFIVLDTETCGTFNNLLTYDVGWVVVDTKGNVYERRSFVVSEIFDGERARMQNAYYAKKLPQYYAGIPLEWQREYFGEIHRLFKQDIDLYRVQGIVAHNARFDLKALDSTCAYLFGIESFFDFDLPMMDTLKMAKEVFKDMPTYIRFCEKHGFMTKHKTPRPQMSAETLYRYITKNPTFEENHTGLKDVLIESQIFQKCINRKGIMWCCECYIL